MATKLTLRMEEDLIEEGKRLARQRGTSLSRLVADYLRLLSRLPETGKLEPLPSVTRSLQGIASGAGVSEEDYRRHLEEKHR